ncbi:MAG: hypothetical protein AYK23_05020 [Candidatus Proteinoplasmatales archaeon SG8-5]|nr:MAG: hypothetical protein AYK23_05020 [Candidatus Proteinoplasmatales archaeon SG8-5]
MGSRRIGTLAEKSLHASLKRWYTEEGDKVERKVDGFYIDIVRGDLLIEIQTANFSQIRRKLVYLLRDHHVHLVHPIPVEKWIVRQDEGGKELSRRRSPKTGKVVDVFEELVRIPNVAMHPNLTVEVLLTRQEEVLRRGGKGARGRRGWELHDRRLLEVKDNYVLASHKDYQKLIPKELPRPFSNRDLAEAVGRPIWLARAMTYTLRRTGAITEVGKRGNAILYM